MRYLKLHLFHVWLNPATNVALIAHCWYRVYIDFAAFFFRGCHEGVNHRGAHQRKSEKELPKRSPGQAKRLRCRKTRYPIQSHVSLGNLLSRHRPPGPQTVNSSSEKKSLVEISQMISFYVRHKYSALFTLINQSSLMTF